MPRPRYPVRFLAAYAVFEVTMTIAWLFIGDLQGHSYIGFSVVVVTLLFAPVAWLPLAFARYCAPSGGIVSVVACVLVGALVASALAVSAAYVIAGLVQDAPDQYPIRITWQHVATQLPALIKSGPPGGAIGGVMFWAVCFRRPRLMPPSRMSA